MSMSTKNNFVRLKQAPAQRLRRLLHMEYTPRELCAELECPRAAIQRAIEWGCPQRVLKSQVWIVGDDFALWYQNQLPARVKLRPGEAYCLRCRAARVAVDLDEGVPNSLGTVRRFGVCAVCGSRVGVFESAVSDET